VQSKLHLMRLDLNGSFVSALSERTTVNMPNLLTYESAFKTENTVQLKRYMMGMGELDADANQRLKQCHMLQFKIVNFEEHHLHK